VWPTVTLIAKHFEPNIVGILYTVLWAFHTVLYELPRYFYPLDTMLVPYMLWSRVCESQAVVVSKCLNGLAQKLSSAFPTLCFKWIWLKGVLPAGTLFRLWTWPIFLPFSPWHINRHSCQLSSVHYGHHFIMLVVHLCSQRDVCNAQHCAVCLHQLRLVKISFRFAIFIALYPNGKITRKPPVKICIKRIPLTTPSQPLKQALQGQASLLRACGE